MTADQNEPVFELKLFGLFCGCKEGLQRAPPEFSESEAEVVASSPAPEAPAPAPAPSPAPASSSEVSSAANAPAAVANAPASAAPPPAAEPATSSAQVEEPAVSSDAPAAVAPAPAAEPASSSAQVGEPAVSSVPTASAAQAAPPTSTTPLAANEQKPIQERIAAPSRASYLRAHPDFSGTWKCEFVHGDVNEILRKQRLGYIARNSARMAGYIPRRGDTKSIEYQGDKILVCEGNLEDVLVIGEGEDQSVPPNKRVIHWEDDGQVLVMDIFGTPPQRWRWSMQDAQTQIVDWYCDGVIANYTWRKTTFNEADMLMSEKTMKSEPQINADLSEEDKQLIEAVRILVGSEEWELIDSKDGTQRFEMPKVLSDFNFIKGRTTVACQFELACKLVSDFDSFEQLMRMTDSLFFEGHVVEKIDDSHGIFYGAFNLPGLASGRDFVWNGLSAITPERHLYVCGASTTSRKIASREAERVVRGHIACFGYLVREIEPGHLMIEYVLQIDPKGTIPDKIVELATKDQCDNVTRLRKFLEHNSS